MSETAGHCPTCACSPDTPKAHSCPWCEINYNHPKCPQNADEELCPHCGSEAEDVTLHRAECPTVGTCAQTYPTLPKPWHPEPAVDGKAWGEWLHSHMAEVHAR